MQQIKVSKQKNKKNNTQIENSIKKTSSKLDKSLSCSCGGGCPRCKKPIQAKLKVNQPNDPYEQEADRIAKQVMRKPTSKISLNHQQEKIKISRKTSDGSNIRSISILSQIEKFRGSGRPLTHSTKQFMESRFGHDFSSVSVHDDARSNELASAVNANAFTYGNDIFLGKNESISNSSLMAHELTHVLQQSNQPAIQRSAISDFGAGAKEGLLSVPGDLYRGMIRTGEGWMLGGKQRALEIGLENERAYEFTKLLIKGTGYTLVQEILVEVIKAKAAKISGFFAGRILGVWLATTAARFATKIIVSTLFKYILTKITVSAAASATGIGIPISLLMIQGLLQRGSEASQRLKSEEPKAYKILRSNNLDMGYFLVEPYMSEIMHAIEEFQSQSNQDEKLQPDTNQQIIRNRIREIEEIVSSQSLPADELKQLYDERNELADKLRIMEK